VTVVIIPYYTPLEILKVPPQLPVDSKMSMRHITGPARLLELRILCIPSSYDYLKGECEVTVVPMNAFVTTADPRTT
jgi:hypothetical protein